MSRVILLDSGPLGMVTTPKAKPPIYQECKRWLNSLEPKGYIVMLPEIADLVRNYIFMKLPSENREEVYQKKWLPLQESFKSNVAKKDYVDELTNAFWFYLRKDGNTINEKEVYQGIKRVFDNSQNGVKAELNKLIQFAGYYQRINFYDRESEPKLQRWFRRLARLDFTTCHIFLLNIYRDYEEQRLSLEEFEKILQYLESYFVRRLFAGISTRSLGIVFNNLYQEVKKVNSEDLVTALRTVLWSYEKSKIWPNDSRVIPLSAKIRISPQANFW